MADLEFGSPAFKLLSKNDSGANSSHQAGVVIPKSLRSLFPNLPEPTAAVPAPSISIEAVLISDVSPPVVVGTSYQYQTWNLTRAKESRVTGGLDPIRKSSKADDLFLMEQMVGEPLKYRLTVLTKGTAMYAAALARTDGKRWGFLTDDAGAVTEDEIVACEAEIEAATAAPFNPFDHDAQLLATSRRIARSRAFRRLVLAAYGEVCAFCGGGARLPGGPTELEAAHVIPRGQKGADDVRNGLALCRLHHWAFDNYLLGLSATGHLRFAAKAKAPENASLSSLDGAPYNQSIKASEHLHPDVIAWSISAFDARWST
jgi:putative restriction endonuclease